MNPYRLHRTSIQLSISEFYENYKLNKYIFSSKLNQINRWSSKRKNLLIYSIFKNYPINTIIMYPTVNSKNQTIFSIIDGNQRLQIILEFINKNLLKQHIHFQRNNQNIKNFWTYKLQIEYFYDIQKINNILKNLGINKLY